MTMNWRAAVLAAAAMALPASSGVGLAASNGEFAVAQLTGSDRDAFVQSSIQSCTSTATQQNPTVPAATITTYCTCMAGKEADMTTPADVAYMAQHHAATEEYTKRVEQLAASCAPGATQ